jgi:hypothetical protein
MTNFLRESKLPSSLSRFVLTIWREDECSDYGFRMALASEVYLALVELGIADLDVSFIFFSRLEPIHSPRISGS